MNTPKEIQERRVRLYDFLRKSSVLRAFAKFAWIGNVIKIEINNPMEFCIRLYM